VKRYLGVLRIRDYRLLWLGATGNLVSDGAAWTALAWMALVQGGAGAVGILSVCYTLPVIAGGVVVGPLVDRFSRRLMLVVDSILRAMVVASVPLVALHGAVPLAQLYVVATVFGFLKIVPLGAVPAVVPDLVPRERLDTAAALETVGFGVANMIGPAIGGALIPLVGGPGVMGIGAVVYGGFVLALLAIHAPMKAPGRRARRAAARARGGSDRGWGPALRLIVEDRVLLAICIGFAFFNLGMGMLRVTMPWIAHDRLPGGAHTLGLLLGLSGATNLAGSLVGGALKTSDKQMRQIGMLQFVSGAALLLLLPRSLPIVLVGVMLCTGTSAPMAVSSQVIRLKRIPLDVRGRTMTLMRTVLNGTIPVGAALASAALAARAYALTIVLMAVIAASPGALVAWAYRGMSFTEPVPEPDVLGVTDEPVPEAVG
jgi:MFS family permease